MSNATAEDRSALSQRTSGSRQSSLVGTAAGPTQPMVPPSSTTSQGIKRSFSHDSTSDPAEPSKHQRVYSPSRGLSTSSSHRFSPVDKLNPDAVLSQIGQAEQEVTTIVHQLVRTTTSLTDVGFQNDDIWDSLEKELAPFRGDVPQHTSVKPTVFLGPSGCGKSSTMNSVLGLRDAAAVSSLGRGTYVPHEYRGADASQLTTYKVVTSYRSPEEVLEMAGRHYDTLVSGRHVGSQNRALEEESVEDDESDDFHQFLDALDEEASKNRSTALTFFHSQLCDHSDFESMDSTAAFFGRQAVEKRSEVVGRLAEMIHALRMRRSCADGDSLDANTEEELADITSNISCPLTVLEGVPRMPHPWPIVAKITVHLSKGLLMDGCVLSDPPGLNDSNGDVAESTEQYLKRAGTIFVFAPLERATNSAELDAQLLRCVRDGKIDQVRLIMTKIDRVGNIDPQNFSNLPAEDSAELRGADAAIAELNRTEKDLIQAKVQSMKDGGHEKFMQLDMAIEAARSEATQAKAKKTQLHIKIQCKLVLPTLQRKLRDVTGNCNAPDLPVHFISNIEHRRHLQQSDAADPPQLDAHTTGISGLEATIRRDVAEHRTDVLDETVRYYIPTALSSLSGMFKQSPFAHKQRVRELMASKFKKAIDVVQDIETQLEHVFIENIEASFISNGREWEQDATSQLNRWSQEFKPITFAAFCRHEGYWKKPGDADKSSWNEALQNMMRKHVDPACDALETKAEKYRRSTKQAIEKLFDGLIQKLRESDAHTNDGDQDAAKSFFKELHCHRQQLNLEVDKAFQRFIKSVKKLRHKLLIYVPNSATDYISTAMRPVYENCSAIQGELKGQKTLVRRGAHKKRLACLLDGVVGATRRRSVFDDAFELMKRDWEALVAELGSALKSLVKRASRRANLSFETRFVERGDSSVGKSWGGEKAQVIEKAKVAHGEMEQRLKAAKAMVKELKVAMEGWTAN